MLDTADWRETCAPSILFHVLGARPSGSAVRAWSVGEPQSHHFAVKPRRNDKLRALRLRLFWVLADVVVDRAQT